MEPFPVNCRKRKQIGEVLQNPLHPLQSLQPRGSPLPLALLSQKKPLPLRLLQRERLFAAKGYYLQ